MSTPGILLLNSVINATSILFHDVSVISSDGVVHPSPVLLIHSRAGRGLKRTEISLAAPLFCNPVRTETAWPSISLDRRALQDLPCRIRVLRPLPFAARSKDPLTESSGPSHSQPARKTRSRATRSRAARSPCPHRRALHSHSQSQRDSDAPPRVIRPISSGDLHTNKVPPRSSHPPRRSLNTKAKERRQSSTPPVRSSTRTPPITQPKRRGSPTGS